MKKIIVNWKSAVVESDGRKFRIYGENKDGHKVIYAVVAEDCFGIDVNNGITFNLDNVSFQDGPPLELTIS